MKKLLIILSLILISQIMVSQTNYEFSTWLKNENFEITNYDFKFDYQVEQEKSTSWQITAVATFIVITEASGDALYDLGKIEGNQDYIKVGKLLQAISLGSHFLYFPIMKNSDTHWLWIPAIEIGWRIIGFDPVYNYIRGNSYGYIGNTSFWDKGMQAFSPPPGIQTFFRGVVTIATVKITFDKF